MTIIQLEYLLAVANCGSFSLAAEHCFVTQPSLSMQVKSLEEELGVVLLDRSKKPVIPTEAGLVDLEKEEIPLYFPEMLRASENCRFTPCTHTTGRRAPLDSGMTYRKSTVSMGLPTLSEYEVWQTDPEEFARCAAIVHGLHETSIKESTGGSTRNRTRTRKAFVWSYEKRFFSKYSSAKS